MVASLELRARHELAAALVAGVRDVIDERAAGAAPPSWCDRRGWTQFLASLPDGDVERAQRDGLAMHLEGLAGAPPDLVALGREIARAVALPMAPAVVT